MSFTYREDVPLAATSYEIDLSHINSSVVRIFTHFVKNTHLFPVKT